MKTIIITGASRGIGRATAQVFLENSWKVIGTSTTGNISLDHPNLTKYQLDLSKPKSIVEFVAALGDKKADVLINNAAISVEERTDPVDIQALRETLEVNVIGTIHLTELLVDKLNNNGKVISISSEFGSLTEDWGYVAPAYRISKAAVNMYTRNLFMNERILEKNIRVCSFDPGWVKTDMAGPNAPGEPEDPANELYELANTDFESGLFYRGLLARDW